MTDPGHRLGAAVDAARLDLGLSKMDLAKIARVGRSTITDLINRGKIPGREVTRGRIEAALGWTPGSFATVLGGAEPTLRADIEYPLSGTAKVLVEQLTQIAQEARAGSAAAETLSKRLELIGDIAESAVQLATRSR
ncbi:helix-turn-helix transcriptional regulator [Mycobacterium sp. IS-1556]|uniref:helix-turn-helix domain-containing protein n=1 Tax=Mycobacterium sp. IS-1556 TaxID=1772276 RepID=UPI0009E98D64|nr:helix-turn-helix transcriptional regulator [Mycobacterium sp. IS-1556]